MKLPSKKRIAIAAFTIAALVLITLVGVLVAVGTMQRPTHRTKVTISVDDLAEMKTLVHKYLNERNRVAVSHDPQSNPNVAGAPVIDPSEMSPELAARQKEDVEKLRAMANSRFSDDFATYTEVLDIRKEGDDIVLDISDITHYNYLLETDPASLIIGEGTEHYYTFARKGDRWILTDAKLTIAYGDTSLTEPSVKPYEAGSSRVLAHEPERITKVPEEIKRLDEEATAKITNKWAIDEKASEAMGK